jgi:hypothetical protein
MDDKKTPKNPKNFYCVTCDFRSSNKKDYNRHLSTAKHKRITMDNKNTLNQYSCICGKKYKFMSGLCKHRNNCREIKKNLGEDKDELSELRNSINIEKDNLKSMFLQMIETYNNNQLEINKRNHENTMEVVNKVVDALPKMGNTINNNNIEKQTLNFYLTNTCKDAETIHDFTERYVKRCVDFMNENYRMVAHNQINMASSIYDLFFKCLSENPQNMNFLQTTDVKNGILYVKEKKKDSARDCYGEAEFIKYMDGFEKAGFNIGHAILRAFNPLQQQYEQILERECGRKPNEDNYEDDEEYERDLDAYNEKVGQLKCSLMVQVYDTVRIFEDKRKRNEILSRTKRLKE